MITLKGAPAAAEIKKKLIAETEAMSGRKPRLAIIRVGEQEDAVSYEKGAVKRMNGTGIETECCSYPEDIAMDEFTAEFDRINNDEGIDGILLLRPLPCQLDEKEILNRINPEKDVDGISPVSMARVFMGDRNGFAPCTAEAVVEILKYYGVEMKGKRAVIAGRSLVVGKPLSMLLLDENCTVTVCHSKTADMEAVCSEADILVAAVGRAKLLKSGHVKENAVVIDVGINVDENGKLCGDVDFDDVSAKAAMATPVPGGVGAVTTSILARHVVQAALRKGL